MYALVTKDTSAKEVARLRGLGYRIVDAKFRDQLPASESYQEPKLKRKETKKQD